MNSHTAIHWKIISTNIGIALLEITLLKKTFAEKKLIVPASLSYGNNINNL